jgi:hypothetical protein
MGRKVGHQHKQALTGTEIESPHLARGEGFFSHYFISSRGRRRSLFFGVFGFVDAPFDLANLLGNGNLFGADFRTLPQGLTTPCPILVIQENHPFFRTLIP